MRLRVTPRAEKQIERAKTWWHSHRDKAPEALEEELALALRLVEEHPHIGVHVKQTHLPNVQRVFLHRVRYHLYYCIVGDVLWVVSLWHAARRPPQL